MAVPTRDGYWPMVCRRGDVSSDLVGAIRVAPKSSTVDIASSAAHRFEQAVTRPDRRNPRAQFRRWNPKARAKRPGGRSAQSPLRLKTLVQGGRGLRPSPCFGAPSPSKQSLSHEAVPRARRTSRMPHEIERKSRNLVRKAKHRDVGSSNVDKTSRQRGYPRRCRAPRGALSKNSAHEVRCGASIRVTRACGPRRRPVRFLS